MLRKNIILISNNNKINSTSLRGLETGQNGHGSLNSVQSLKRCFYENEESQMLECGQTTYWMRVEGNQVFTRGAGFRLGRTCGSMVLHLSCGISILILSWSLSYLGQASCYSLRLDTLFLQTDKRRCGPKRKE